MNWNPYKRIADLEERVENMNYEMLRMAANYGMRLSTLEMAKPAAASGLLTLEQTQALLDKRVRQNAAARKHYAKRKAKEAQS
jgi:hypothetical protein